MEGNNNQETINFEAGFEELLADLSTQRRLVEVLDSAFLLHLGPQTHLYHQEYQDIYEQFQYEHVKRLVDVLENNEHLSRLSFPVNILNEDTAVYLGQAVNRMTNLLELSLGERFRATDPMAHLVLSQLDPEISKLQTLRVEARLLASRDVESYLRTSAALQLVELNLCGASMQEEAVARLGNALRHSQNIQCLVLQSTTWQRLAIFLESISDNPRIDRLDIFFDMRVGGDMLERHHAMLECMHLLASNTALQTLYISEPQSELELPRYQSALADALRTNNSIRVLHMEGTINQDGINALSEALEVNTTVESLTFPSVRHGSMTPFAERLGSMNGLKTVMFWGSQMLSSEEAEAIAEGLSQNTRIWHLQFSYNARSPRLAERIRYYLQVNGMGAHELVATAPVSLMPRVLAIADRRSLSMLYTFINQRSDIFYYR